MAMATRRWNSSHLELRSYLQGSGLLVWTWAGCQIRLEAAFLVAAQNGFAKQAGKIAVQEYTR